MKKILILILLLFSIVGYSQTYNLTRDCYIQNDTLFCGGDTMAGVNAIITNGVSDGQLIYWNTSLSKYDTIPYNQARWDSANATFIAKEINILGQKTTKNLLEVVNDIVGSDSTVSVNSMGYAGIRTNDPKTFLHVYGEVDEDVFCGIGKSPESGGTGALTFGYGGNSFGDGSGFFNVRPTGTATGINPALYFLTQNVTRMVIDKDGNIGMGTTAPTGQLTIDGNKTTSNLFEAINDNDGVAGDSTVLILPDGSMDISGDVTIKGNHTLMQGSATGLLLMEVDNSSAAAGTVVGASMRVTNDNNYYASWGITNSGTTFGGGAFNNSPHLYNQGYNHTLYSVDGNYDHIWYTDPTNSHNYSCLSNEVMRLAANGNLTTTGGHIVNTTTVNASTYDLLVTDFILNVTYTATGAVTSLTLPTAQTVAGRIIVVKNVGGANSITIDTEAAQTIDGAATAVLSSQYDAINLYCDGTNWFIY